MVVSVVENAEFKGFVSDAANSGIKVSLSDVVSGGTIWPEDVAKADANASYPCHNSGRAITSNM